MHAPVKHQDAPKCRESTFLYGVVEGRSLFESIWQTHNNAFNVSTFASATLPLVCSDMNDRYISPCGGCRQFMREVRHALLAPGHFLFHFTWKWFCNVFPCHTHDGTSFSDYANDKLVSFPCFSQAEFLFCSQKSNNKRVRISVKIHFSPLTSYMTFMLPSAFGATEISNRLKIL